MDFDEAPDYFFLRQLLLRMLPKSNKGKPIVAKFDWNRQDEVDAVAVLTEETKKSLTNAEESKAPKKKKGKKRGSKKSAYPTLGARARSIPAVLIEG